MVDVGAITRGRVTVRRSGATGEVVVGPPNSIAWTIVTVPVLCIFLIVCFGGAWAVRRHPTFAVLWMLWSSPAVIFCAVQILMNHRDVRSVDVGTDAIVVSRRCGPWSSTARFRRVDIDGWKVWLPLAFLQPPYYLHHPDIAFWGRGPWRVKLVGPARRACVVAKDLTLGEAALVAGAFGAMGFPSLVTDPALNERLASVEGFSRG